MTFYIIGLMVHFNNYSDAMFHYLLLHGSYGKSISNDLILGIFWFLKDTIFPDPAFQSNVTLGSALIAWIATLGPYLVPAYRLASGKASNDVSFERAWLCTLIYVFGVVIMLLADSQKFYVLKYKKGLIADGMMRHSRNPNYLGEMMIYGSFVLLVNDWISYICIVQVWCSLFILRMWQKERSLKQKEGWPQYKKTSWILFPKINGRFIDSIIFYGVVIIGSFWMYRNGGIKASIIKLAGGSLNESRVDL
jgi:protein-S-isoprenylcysteine O-methyltransferase Ste14